MIFNDRNECAKISICLEQSVKLEKNYSSHSEVAVIKIKFFMLTVRDLEIDFLFDTS